MTLDQAQDRFRDNPNEATAYTYRRIVEQYFNDEMVGEGTLTAAIKEIDIWREDCQK